MANTANMTITTNFNVTPYYDDYDETKGYYRILFKPGFAVQGRELTQMQTMLQKQIDRFGRHFFDEGSIVVPGLPELFAANTLSSLGPANYVKVKDVDDNDDDVVISKFDGIRVTGLNSGVNAIVSFTQDGLEIEPVTKTLYVDYSSASNTNSSVVRFEPGEKLVSNVGNLFVLSSGASPIGYGSAYRISTGVIFSKGHFVYFPTQEVILDPYNPSPTCRVGFKIYESIVSTSDDSSLLDPALEASNYSAPGADRFKMIAELQRRDYDDNSDLPDFVSLFAIKDGIVEAFTNRTTYSIIRDEFARRTFDESGDYYVKGLNVELREHKKTITNGGLFANGNANLVSIKIEPGVAYVKGYEVGTISPTYLTTPKSTEYANVTDQIVSAFLGSYVTVDEMIGQIQLDKAVSIDLYDTAQNRISSGLYAGLQTGNKIGTANVAGIEYNSGIVGTANGRSDLYLMDVQMLGQNSFSQVRSVYINNPTLPDFGADVVLNPSTNTAVLNEPFDSVLLYYTGSDFTRKIRDKNDLVTTRYYYGTTRDSLNVPTSGPFTADDPLGADLPYTGSLSTSRKREIFLNLNSSVNVATGWNVSNNQTEIVGVGSDFTRFSIGDKIEFGVAGSGTRTVTSISNTTHMRVDSIPAVTVTSAPLFKVYKAGDYIDLTTKGITTGLERTVSASGPTFTINLQETFPNSVGASISFKAAKRIASPASKRLRPSRYVKIDCSSHPSGTTGPYNLGLTDVYRIKSIRKDTGSFPASNTVGIDVTTQFTLDNGQRDTHYDQARLIPKTTLSSTDRLLVELDYFYPDFSISKGHFNIESYPVDDNSSATDIISTAEIPIYRSPTSGKTYDLRNHLDFRPVKVVTANDSTSTGATATINPAKSSAFINSSAGLNLVFPSSDVEFDYSYYLARKDVVHVNKDRIFSVKQGVPSITPITPEFSDNEMALAVLTISPYPSISPYFAKLIGRQDISCAIRKVAPVRHTMREIGVMKERIGNLEYYAALSLLEKNALDMMIKDENGLDRFKNGIFVDTFTDHLLGDTGTEDYRIVVDPKEKSIRPLYSMQSIKYDYLSGTNVVQNGDLVTLRYDEVEFANVSSATSTLNTERSTYRFIGNMTLVPGEDVWIDPITLPPNCISINDANLDGMEDAQQVGGVTTTWNAWQTAVTGYKVYTGEGANKTLVGTFATQAEADRAAQNARSTSLGATIETLYQSNRTGTESFTYADADTTSIGTRVVDTQVVPYIRAQTIMGSVTGLKPFAKFDTFFDSIKMSAYTRPITESEFNNISTVKSWSYNEGAELRANENGELWFRLRLPENDNLRFTVGQKNVLVTDSETNSDVATSFAEKTFFAQGVIQTKQDTILSTRQVEIRQQTISQSSESSTFSSLPPLPPPPPPPPPDNPTPIRVSFPERRSGGGGDRMPAGGWRSHSCLAYVMPIKAPAGEEGLFLTAVEIFCAEKHPTLGMWVEVRELDSGGGITKNQVPFSEKWFKNSQVPISTNGKTNGLKVTFDSPIFLYADRSYAFIIHPEAANPNYYFWVSRIGETDVNTGEQVTGRAYYGTTFTTNNDTIWVARDEIDVTCKWYRAKFDLSGSFIIGNTPKEKIYLDNIQGSIEGFGEPLITGDILTISGGPTIAANDFIIGQSTSTNGKVIQITAGKYEMSNIRYSSTEVVDIYDGTGGAFGSSKGTATITAVENGRGYMEYSKENPQSRYIILNNSNGKFKANNIVFDISDEGYGTINRIEDLRYSVIDFEPAIITFSKTTNSYEMAAYTNAGSALTGIKIDSGENFEFAQDMKIMSRSNENALISGDRSNKVTVTISTTSDYLSPVFDLGKTQSIIVDNIINANTVGEDAQSGGQLFNKYISKIVTLAENQDAEDIKVYTTAYRPPGTDVKVWIKILNGEDSDTMTQRPWIEMEKSFGGDITYSSLANKNDFKEYTYNIPASYMTSPNIGAVQYVNSQGVTLTRFKSFQIKIGLIGSSTESYKVPRVADLRTVAVQM